MRIIFMGTPVFAVQAVEALRLAGHEITAVYTQPPRPAGRGQKLQASPVQLWAQQHNIPVETPVSLKKLETQAHFRAWNADIAIVAAYGLLLPTAILETPPLGCLNIHASLLPRWRGAAPIQRAILAGDTETGITIMQMDEGLDTGAMLRKDAIPIHDTDTGETLHDRLATLGASLIVETLATLSTLYATSQPATGATYAAKIEKNETRLDTTLPAIHLARIVRAFALRPAAWFEWQGQRIKILKASVVPVSIESGIVHIAEGQALLGCGENSLALQAIIPAGKTLREGKECVAFFSA